MGRPCVHDINDVMDVAWDVACVHDINDVMDVAWDAHVCMI